MKQFHREETVSPASASESPKPASPKSPRSTCVFVDRESSSPLWHVGVIILRLPLPSPAFAATVLSFYARLRYVCLFPLSPSPAAFSLRLPPTNIPSRPSLASSGRTVTSGSKRVPFRCLRARQRIPSLNPFTARPLRHAPACSGLGLLAELRRTAFHVCERVLSKHNGTHRHDTFHRRGKRDRSQPHACSAHG